MASRSGEGEDVQPCYQEGYKMLDYVESATLDIRGKLDKKLVEIEEIKKRIDKVNSDIESCETTIKDILKMVREAVQIAYESKLNAAEEEEREDIRLINKKADEQVKSAMEKNEKPETCEGETDEEISYINENRDKQVTTSRESAERLRVTIKESQARLVAEIEMIDGMVVNKLAELKSKNQQEREVIDNIICKTARMRQDDDLLTNEGSQVITSLDQSSRFTDPQEVPERLERIKSEVLRLRFFERKIGGRHNSRIDGYLGSWELTKSFDVPSSLQVPWVCGVISDDDVCLWDIGGYNMYAANITTGEVKKVFEGTGGRQRILSCASLDSNVIVSDKGGNVMFGGDAYRGSVVLYDRQWEVLKRIYMPNDYRSSYTIVLFDVDNDGMILAALHKQDKIYVINPADGEIVDTITIQGKNIVGAIHTLSSGDIVLRTEDTAFTIISKSGEIKAEVHRDEWDMPWGRVDKLTGALYVKYMDKERNVFVVDQVNPNGTVEAKGIIEYPVEEGCHPTPFAATPTGVLAFCNGKQIFVYKKIFVV